MDDLDREWQRKGASLSDKRAREEFGLTQGEIVDAVDAGKLHYRLSSTHGNPWFRLLRSEVEELVKTAHGDQHLRQVQVRSELVAVNRELKRLRAQLAALEERRAALIAGLAPSN